MEGNILVTYKILCDSDLNIAVKLQDLLLNEKISRAIKSEFAKGLRNIELATDERDATLFVGTKKELYSFEVLKDDFADILVLAEENASSRKLFKKDCSRVELVDIETII